jgi:hypothetical protein
MDELCLCGHNSEVCNDGRDNDCNGLIDCADPACRNDPSCKQCTPEICSGGLDENCNQLIDCADPACLLDPVCRTAVEICSNGKDDNANGLADCDDPACVATTYCTSRHENCTTALTVTASGTYYGDTSTFYSHTTGSCGGAAGEAVFKIVLTQPTHLILTASGTSFDSVVYLRKGSCKAGLELGCDDDSGGSWAGKIDIPIVEPGTYFAFFDGFAYSDIGSYQANITVDTKLVEICDDKVDNDGNGLADCADPACASFRGCAGAKPEIGVTACTNGIDDDRDGLMDCADPDCHASPYYDKECCNGKDDNGNGIVDEYACYCIKDTDCTWDQICNLTTKSCALPCYRIVGQSICPAVAPGTVCNQVSGQCVYP